jgi:glycosyltransferase involved in cell wall biosynthesis
MEQPLKVLHIASEKTWRGGENQIRLLMDGMRSRGHDPFLAADPGSEIYRRLARKFPSVAVPMARISWPATVLRLHRFCRRHGITLIDAHSSKAHDLGLGLVTLDRRRKLVVHRRVDYPVGKPYAPLKYRSSKVARYVAISNAIARILQNAGIDPSRIVTVRSAVEAGPHQGIDRQTARDALRHMLGLPRDTLLVGNASALSEQKGYGYLMKACALLRDQGLDFHCVIAGDGPLRDALEQQRIELSLDNHVSFLGFIAKVPEFLAALDIFAMTSIDEGLGTSALDAAQAGCALVASNVGGLPEIVRDGETGLIVPPRDPSAIAAAITRLAGDSDLRATLAHAARATVQRDFSVDAMVEGNIHVYESLFPR